MDQFPESQLEQLTKSNTTDLQEESELAGVSFIYVTYLGGGNAVAGMGARGQERARRCNPEALPERPARPWT